MFSVCGRWFGRAAPCWYPSRWGKEEGSIRPGVHESATSKNLRSHGDVAQGALSLFSNQVAELLSPLWTLAFQSVIFHTILEQKVDILGMQCSRNPMKTVMLIFYKP